MNVTKPNRLLLASRSPRRRELLVLLGLPFEVRAADVAEDPRGGESPAALAARLSRVKARAISAQGVVIASDTVVAVDGNPLGKPGDEEEARQMLRSLRGRAHTVYSGITLLRQPGGEAITAVAETQVVMRRYTDAEIAAYVTSGDPMDKAGAYAIQHAGFHPVAELNGCYANVMGLPLCHLAHHLYRWGLRPVRPVPAACQAYTGRHCQVYHTIVDER